jgi:signal transduction histidine kinase
VARRSTTAVAVGLLLAGAAGLGLVGWRALVVEREAARLRAGEGARRLVEREATLLESRLEDPLPSDPPPPPSRTWSLDAVPAADPLGDATEGDRLLLAEAAFLVRARDDAAGASALLRRLAAKAPASPLARVAALRAGALAVRAGDETAARALLAQAAEAADDAVDPEGTPVRAAALVHAARLDFAAGKTDGVAAALGALGEGARLGTGDGVDRGDLAVLLAEAVPAARPPLDAAVAERVSQAAARARDGRRLLDALEGRRLAAVPAGIASRRGDVLEERTLEDLEAALTRGAGGRAGLRVGAAPPSAGDAVVRRLRAPLDSLAVWMRPDDALADGAPVGILALAAGLAVYALGSGLAVVAVRKSARAARMKEDFVAAVSHEMKTPIAAVQAMAEMLAQGRITGPERAREYAERMRAEMQRLGATVRNVLDAARIERGAGPLVAPRTLDPAGVVESVAGVVRPVLAARGFSFDVDVRPAPRPMAVDPDALTSVLVNLLDNAAKFSGERREVVLRGGPRAGGYRVEVLDRGPGVPAADRDHVFDRFWRGDAARRDAVPGIGLGLHVARRLVSAHGGSLRVEERDGGGAAFVVDLPEGPS